MPLTASPDLQSDRQAVHAALDMLLGSLEDDPPASHTDLSVRRFDAGLAWVGNRVGEGGLGVDPDLQEMVDERLHASGHLDVSDQRAAQRGLFAPVIVKYGTS